MATLDEILQNKSMLDQFNELTGRINKQKDAEDILTPKVDTETRILDNLQKSKEARLADNLPKTIDADLAVPVGDVQSIGPSSAELKNKFLAQKNMGEMVGSPTGENPSNQLLKHMFKGGDKPVMPLADGVDDLAMNEMNALPKAASAAAPMEEAAAPGMLQKLSALPEESLAKMGPIGQKILQSRAAGLLGKGMAGVSIPLEIANAKDNFSKGENMSGTMNLAGAGSGAAALAGSPAALPLGMMSGGYALGNAVSDKMGGEYKGPVAPNDPNAEPTTPPVVPPGQNSTPPQGMGPFADISKYKPSMNGLSFGTSGSWDDPKKEEDDSGRSIAASVREKMSEKGGGPKEARDLASALSQDDGFSENTVENLRTQQEAANKEKTLNSLIRNLNKVTSAQIGKAHHSAVTPDDELLRDEDKVADNKVTQFKERLAKEAEDPNSKSSKKAIAFAAPLLKQAGFDPKMLNGMSQAELEKKFPIISSMMKAKDDRESREEIARQRSLDRQAALKIHGDNKKAVDVDKYANKLKDDLDPNKARGGNLAKSQLMINNAERLEALFNQFPDGNVPKAQTQELATGVAALINGGSAQSQHQIDSIVPESLKGKGADAISKWITNNPMGREQQGFIKLIKETTMREKDTATHQVRQAQIQRLPAHKKLKDLDPDTYNELLQSYGIDPNEIVDGKYTPPKKDAPAPGQEIVEKGGRKFLVDHNTKKVIKEIK
jgi:hypothetical protein